MMNDEQLFEQVGERMNFFAGGYAYGLYGEANIAWLKDQSYGDVFWYGDIYRLGYAAAFDAPKIMTDEIRAKLLEFLDETAGISDYPLMDDWYYNHLMIEGENKWFESFVSEYGIDGEKLSEYLQEYDIYFQEEGGYVYPANFDEDVALLEIRRNSQSWEQHYKSGLFHEPHLCLWCVEAEEFEQSQKTGGRK
jgi:hypothetical protein